MNLTPEQLLTEANSWVEQAEAHRRAARFCDEQRVRFLAELAVADDYVPELRLIRYEEEVDG